MSTYRRKALLFVLIVGGAAACGIGGAALGSLLLGCGPSTDKPIVAPNPNGANCLVERQKQQLDCVAKFATRTEIEKCIADKLKSGEAPTCDTEAGVAAFVSRDAGGQ